MRKSYRKMMGILLGVAVCVSALPVQAAQVQNGAVYEVTTNQIPDWPQAPEIVSETGIVMDAETGAILYNKGMDEIRYPASITKIMTCMLALERTSLDDQVTFTQTVLSDPNAGGTNIGMQAGEVLTMGQCLDVLMVQSANDVATQIAEYVGGSVQAFVDLMNQRAQELGCVNTHFANASGMPDENHYTTAHDMALIFREAIKNETFREIIGKQNVILEPTNLNPEKRTYSCHHALVAQSAPEYYEGCFGGKTGVTEAAKNTLVSGVVRNGMTLIAVTLRAEVEQIYQDQIKLFDYAFSNFSHVEVPGGVVTVPNGKTAADLTVQEASAEVGAAQNYYYNGEYYLGSGVKEDPTQEVVAEEPTPEPIVTVDPKIQEENARKAQAQKAAHEKEKQIYQYTIYILAGLIGLTLIITIIAAVKKNKKKKQNKQQNKQQSKKKNSKKR